MFGAGCTALEVCRLTELLFHLSGGTGAEPIPLPAMRRRLERAALFTPDGNRPAHTRPVTVFRVAG
jgi:8-oxo-dGTP diphosphatase